MRLTERELSRQRFGVRLVKRPFRRRTTGSTERIKDHVAPSQAGRGAEEEKVDKSNVVISGRRPLRVSG